MYTTAKTKLLGVFGNPIGHTLSPKLHSIIAEKTKSDVVYLAFSATDEEFSEKVRALKIMEAQGFNITIPHKIRVMECLDVIDDDAHMIGAVNTAVNKNGVWYGYNTDGIGFLKSLEVNNVSITGKNILMLGAGGSARSVAYSVCKNGAKSITISARTKEKAEDIGNLITENTKCLFNGTEKENIAYDIIINTTPLGMKPHEDKNPLDCYDNVSDKTVLIDLIYSPWETLFLQEGKRRGAKTINGLGMLAFQGIYAFEHFMDKKYDDRFFIDIYNTFEKEFRK